MLKWEQLQVQAWTRLKAGLEEHCRHEAMARVTARKKNMEIKAKRP